MGNRITETNESLLAKLHQTEKLQSSPSGGNLSKFNSFSSDTKIETVNSSFDNMSSSGIKENSILATPTDYNNNAVNNNENVRVPGISFSHTNNNFNTSNKSDVLLNENSTPTSSKNKLNMIKEIGKIKIKPSKKTKDSPATAEIVISSHEKELIKKTSSLLMPSMNTGRPNGGRRESFLHRTDVESFDSSQKVRKASMVSNERSEQ